MKPSDLPDRFRLGQQGFLLQWGQYTGDRRPDGALIGSDGTLRSLTEHAIWRSGVVTEEIELLLPCANVRRRIMRGMALIWSCLPDLAIPLLTKVLIRQPNTQLEQGI